MSSVRSEPFRAAPFPSGRKRPHEPGWFPAESLDGRMTLPTRQVRTLLNAVERGAANFPDWIGREDCG